MVDTGIQFHSLTAEENLARLESFLRGLDKNEAEKRLNRFGFNELKIQPKISALKIFLSQFSSPLIWILILALIVALYLGEVINAIVIALIVVVNAVLGFVQEFKAEKAIESLKKITSFKAKVIRDGKELLLESKYLVPGDIIILDTGDIVPADSRLLEVYNLEVQESLLTGESQAVVKFLDKLAEKTVLADRRNMLYNGTIITKGRGKAVVCATGINTEIGKIAEIISEAEEKITPLQKKLKQLRRYIAFGVVFIALIIFIIGIFSGQAVSVMFLTAIALAVAAIPEGLPAVITISLSIGVQRMLKKNALIRKLTSVETLGSVNVICTDKTGTLTCNEMTVVKLFVNNKVYSVTGSGYEKEGLFLYQDKPTENEELSLLLKVGMLCNCTHLSRLENKVEVIGDPTEAALIVSAEKANLNLEELNKEYLCTDEIPFSSERKMMSIIHEFKHRNIAFSKGAPDVIIEKCNRIYIDGKVYRLERDDKKNLQQMSESFASDALRVLAFAYKENFSKKEDAEKEMIFVGLQAMIDPPRAEVKDAIQKCNDAGIRVIMITGDHLETAKAIGAQIGIVGKAVNGDELDCIDLNQEIKDINIFARVNPEDKSLIVNALHNSGYVVAMTGDGINDAPALKNSDIGIAMGKGGTDVARDASDLILLDNNFSTIIKAVEEGRGIFDNIQKFINYILSTNLGEVFLVLFSILLGLPLPLTVIQILWINLITDGLPATALSLDPYSKEIMKQKPRSLKENIINKVLIKEIFFFGLIIGILALVMFWLFLDFSLVKAQTLTFTTVVILKLVQLYFLRSSYKVKLFSNKWLIVAVISSIVLQLVVIYTPLAKIFGTEALGFKDWGMVFGSALILILVSIVFRVVSSRWRKEK